MAEIKVAGNETIQYVVIQMGNEQYGIDIKYIIKTAKKVNDNITSFSSAMCRVLNKYVPKETLKDKCPDCGGELIREGGCIHCKNCGYSKCE